VNPSAAGQILRERLEELDELSLQSLVVEPLLEADGFRAVRDVSGPNEKGRDLVASKMELGTEHFYAVQIKKLRVSGRVEDPQSLMNLLYQLDQAIHEEAFDPATLAKRVPDRLIFVTPYKINRSAMDASVEKYRSLSRNQVTIIDGATLASEVLRLIPHVALSLSDKLGYRLRLAAEHGVIKESGSFGVTSPLTLNEMFVEADYACFDDLENLYKDFLESEPQRANAPTLVAPACSTQELALLAAQEARWAGPAIGAVDGAAQSAVQRLVRSLVVMEWTRIATPEERVAQGFDLEAFIKSLLGHATGLITSISAFTSTDSEELLDETHRRIARLQAAVAALRKTVILRRRSHLISEVTRREVVVASNLLKENRRLLTYRHLYMSSSVIAIAGVAGAGKTTLMRTLLTKATEEDLRREVVFVRAIDVSDCTVPGLVNELLASRKRSGGEISGKLLQKKMSAGELRVMIDGLDEAGSRAQKLANTILDFTKAFPACPVTVTTRETVDLSEWHSAVHLRLCPFTNNQLTEFIARWYAAKPSAREGLQRWLQEHPTMQEIARTPLVAALMCSLYQVGESVMPMSEKDVYEKRLDFLLGRWEEAKTIYQMPERARTRYKLFLMHVAHEAHERQVRSLQRVNVIRLASRFMTPLFNPNAESLIKDCLGRGLLQEDVNGELTLGHLVHQEFLSGKYMQQYNNLGVIASRLGSDWWSRPLEFYASLIGDISALLANLTGSQHQEHATQLNQLISASGETPPDARW
jgi:hypothetical protein